MSEPQLSEGVLVIEPEEWKSSNLPVIPLPPLPPFYTAGFFKGVLSFTGTFFGGLLILLAFRFLR